jgi:hypothetical protein
MIFVRQRNKSRIDSGPGIQGVHLAPPSESRRLGESFSFSGKNGTFRVREIDQGGRKSVLLERRRGRDWPHPWFTELLWSEKYKDWAAQVKPGFVNGIDPVCPAADDIPPFTEPAISFSGKAQLSSPGLMDGPLIPLSGPAVWKTPGSIPYAVKKFFDTVSIEPRVSLSGSIRDIDNARILIDETRVRAAQAAGESQGSEREVYSTDIVVIVARPSYQQDNQIRSDGFGGIWTDVNVGFSVLSVMNFPRPRLQIMQMPKSSNNSFPGTFDPLKASQGDEGLDYLKIGTIYAASPIKPPSGDIDMSSILGSADRGRFGIPEDWEMLVQYNVFWNLEHRARNLRPINLRQGPVVDAATSMFVGRYAPGAVGTTNMIANLGNSIFSNVLNSRTNEGTFWNT